MSELSGDGGTVGPGQSTSGQVPAAHGTAPSPATLRKPVSRAQTLRAQRTVSYIAAVSDEADDNEGRAAAAAHMRSHRDAQRPDDGTSANCIFTAPTLSDPTALGRGTRGRFTCRLVTHNVFGLPAVNCAFHEAPHTVARGAKIGTVLACIRCDNPQSVYAHSCASAEPLAHVHVSTHMARTLHTMLWPVCHSLSLTHLDKYSPPPTHTHTTARAGGATYTVYAAQEAWSFAGCGPCCDVPVLSTLSAVLTCVPAWALAARMHSPFGSSSWFALSDHHPRAIKSDAGGVGPAVSGRHHYGAFLSHGLLLDMFDRGAVYHDGLFSRRGLREEWFASKGCAPLLSLPTPLLSSLLLLHCCRRNQNYHLYRRAARRQPHRRLNHHHNNRHHHHNNNNTHHQPLPLPPPTNSTAT
jgi:hypothetical protein